MTRAATLLAFTLLASCATPDLRPDYERAQELVRTTTGRPDVHDPEAPPLAPEEVEAALADGLGQDEALRLALLNNRRLQAEFQQLGIARAEWVRSGLLENPTLGLAFLFPAGDDGRTSIAGSLAVNASRLWRLPERRRVAQVAEQQVLLELGQAAGRLVAETRAAYARAVAARDRAAAAAEAAAAATRAQEAVRTQLERGVATELQLLAARGEALAAGDEARAARRAESDGVRRLAALLSLEGDLHGVTLLDPLPEGPPGPLDREALVARALESRLDLAAARSAVSAAEARLELERERAGPEVELGVGYDRPESDDPTDHMTGPTLGVELPLFHRNQAGIARAEHELAQRRRELEALGAELRQEVRAAVDAVTLASDGARFLQHELLPQAERAAALAREAFDAGSTTLLPLLEAERTLARARMRSIEGALELALAAAALELALGGPQDPGSGTP